MELYYSHSETLNSVNEFPSKQLYIACMSGLSVSLHSFQRPG